MMYRSDVQLQDFNTLKVVCTAKYFLEIISTYQLLQLLQDPLWQSEKKWILGGGSNTLFCEPYFDGIVVHMQIKGIKILQESDQSVIVQIGAGEDWEEVIDYAQSHHLLGIENLIAIPGKAGTSVISNIGAYGQEISSCVHEVVGLNLHTQTIQKLTAEECQFAYRESIFKHELEGKFIITHVLLKLQKLHANSTFETNYADIQQAFVQSEVDFAQLSPVGKLQTISQVIREIRASKLPDHHQVGTAGSFFKNPEVWLVERDQLSARFPQLKAHLTPQETMKLSAGQLIELCGWKGKVIDGVKMSDNHALILINTASEGEKVARYAQMVQESVMEKFGIQLEPEVRYCYG